MWIPGRCIIEGDEKADKSFEKKIYIWCQLGPGYDTSFIGIVSEQNVNTYK